jgi:ligand-binding sensor domain-containing protein
MGSSIESTTNGTRPTDLATEYLSRRWLPQDGLPQSAVMAIAQTTNGYLWVGTQHGLARFDGLRFTVFGRQELGGTRTDYIRHLAADDHGNLWVGTHGGGVVQLGPDGRCRRLWGRSQGLSSDTINALLVDPDGTLWVGTSGDGLNRIAGDSVRQWRTTNGLPGNTVSALCRDPDGGLWIGTDNGIARLNSEGSFRSWLEGDGPERSRVTSIAATSEGRLVAAVGGAVVEFKGDTWVPLLPDVDPAERRRVVMIHPATGGGLWLGTQKGLALLRNGICVAIGAPGEPSDDLVVTLFADREGNLWVGSLGGGLGRLKPRQLRAVTQADGLPRAFVFSLCEDAAGTVWAGTYGGGLVRIRETAERFAVEPVPRVPQNVVRSVVAAPDGVVWVGTYGGGLYRLDHEAVQRFTTHEGLPGDQVYAIHREPDGRMLVGTSGGLAVAAGDRFRPVPAPDGSAAVSVRTICPGRPGEYWVGTQGSGLLRFSEDRLTRVAGWTELTVLSLAPAAGSGVWIGTSGGGLHLWRDGQAARWTPAEGLPDDVVYQVLPDAQGRVWLATGRGICHVSTNELDAVRPGGRARLHPVEYGVDDGMPSAECNGGNQPAGMRDRLGRFWFPTVQGIVVLDPASLGAKPISPVTVIERVLADDAEVLGSGQKIGPGIRRLAFKYTGLDLGSPERVRFQVKLEGFDDDWRDVGHAREDSFTSLAPGSYVFRVRAADRFAQWDDTAATFAFELLPRFYQTFWFKGLGLGGVVLAAWAGHWFRTAQLRRRQVALQQEVAERTQHLEERTAQLERASAEIKTLHGLLPICSHCKKIRDEQGAWQALESYITHRSGAQFSHGICPDCLRRHFPEFADEITRLSSNPDQSTES